MLIRFGFSNYRSINEYQEISFVASRLSEEKTHLFTVNAIKEKVLPVISIYGANATGKSNVLHALQFMRNGILKSHRLGDISGRIARKYFLLDEDSKSKKSIFDCDFVLDDVHFHYGFSINNEVVLEEWLFSFPKQYKQVWFHRKHNEKKPFYFGKFLKGRNKTIESLTRDNSLFLSTAAQNNHKMLTPIFEYFKNSIEFDFGRGEIPPFVLEDYLEDPEERQWLVKFLKCADIGIADIKVQSLKDKKFGNFEKELINLITRHTDEKEEPDLIEQSELKEELMDAFSKDIKIQHLSKKGNDVFFSIKDESLGTRKLIAILGPIYEALKNGTLLVIDEIDTSMHPLLSRKIIELFQSKDINPNNAQLLFSTHDSNLLSGQLLRRDQIWFTEKGKWGETIVYPLTDISTRKGDNIEAGYLQGRFGAVPLLDALCEYPTFQ